MRSASRNRCRPTARSRSCERASRSPARSRIPYRAPRRCARRSGLDPAASPTPAPEETTLHSVDFYYSIGSRYSYLAASQLDRLAAETGCTFVWCPVDSRRLIGSRPDDPFAAPSPGGQYAPDYRARDVARWAAHYGIPYVEPVGRVRFDPREIALACTAARRLGAGPAVSRGLYAAMYGGACEVLDAGTCTRVAVAAGLDAERFAAELASPATATDLDASTAAAARAGAFGVPTIVVAGEAYWGNDRLVLLRDRLLAGAG